MQWIFQIAGREGLVEFLLGGYKRWIAPLFWNSCRFSPSCSEYAAEAVIQHGWIRGSALAVKRVFRCHPFGASGYDPVPHGSHSEQLRS